MQADQDLAALPGRARLFARSSTSATSRCASLLRRAASISARPVNWGMILPQSMKTERRSGEGMWVARGCCSYPREGDAVFALVGQRQSQPTCQIGCIVASHEMLTDHTR